MNSIKYRTVAWAEMKPDCYGGFECDEIVPMWDSYWDGDMDSDHSTDPLILDCTRFPAGTKVTIEMPCCPECGQDVEMCKLDESCSFDWEQWTLDRYS